MFQKLNGIIFFLLIANSIHAQSAIDSLIDLYQNQENTLTEKRSLLNLIAKEYAEQDPDTAITIAWESLSLTDDPNDSLSGQNYIAFSTAYSYKAMYDSSNAFAFRALRIGEEYDDKVTIFDALNNLGIDYFFQENYDEALVYFERVRDVAIEINDTLRWGHALNNIGMIYGYQDAYQKELNYYQQAGMLFQAVGDKEGYANTLLNSGTTYTLIEQFTKADQLYLEAFELFKEINVTSGMQQSLFSAAENKYKQGNYSEARKLVDQSLDIIIEHGYLQDEIYSYRLLTEIAESSGDYEEALKYHRMMTEKKEEVFNLERSRQMDELHTQYETEKKEQQLALNKLQLLQSRNEKLLLIGVIFVILVVGAYVYISMKKRSELEMKLLTEEVDNLRLKINSLLGSSEGVKFEIDEINEKLHQPLSDREFEILEQTVSDKSNKEIADALFVSVNTVKFHLKNIYEKLGVSNRKEAISFVINKK